jgi:hypothetical protein
MRRFIFFFLVTLLFLSVTNWKVFAQSKDSENFTPQFTAGPPTIVYKTRQNYNNLIPVLLSEDKRKIISYPSPEDVNRQEHLLPSQLQNGYLLDNKGINKNVAFLKMSYKEYADLKKTPSLSQLYKMIKDKDPLLEMYDCGNRYAYKDVQNQLNNMILTKTLRSKCRVIK